VLPPAARDHGAVCPNYSPRASWHTHRVGEPDTANYVVPPVSGVPRAGRLAPPTFSVLIPCYQAADTVGEAVASVLSQTVPPNEVIVCDDGSTDDLEKALAPYRDRIVVLRQENRGVAAARNLGLRHATGEFVSVCDADDVYLPSLLAELSRLVTARPDLDILCCDAFLETDGRDLGRGRTDPATFVTSDQRLGILRDNFVPGRSAFRRQLLVDAGGYDESLSCAEDWDSWIRLILGGARAGMVDLPLARTRLRPGSLTSSRTRLLEGGTATLAKALARPDLTESERAVASGQLALLCHALELAEARQALTSGRPDGRRRCWRIAISPSYPARTRMKALLSVIVPRAVAWRTRQMETVDDRTRRLTAEDPVHRASRTSLRRHV